ncbi:MAG TPA: hypothetical protein VE133_15640 [Candidatus Sulfotelmatobacter sp.]|nr:hypothetical protein [Candidatus Sulfotelmatobacter sp.]
MKKLLFLLVLITAAGAQQESFHRAEQDREISYWLLDPASHQFRISHDFTVTRTGQKSVHSFVRKGSAVSPDARMIDLDTGKPLKTSTVKGKEVMLWAIILSRLILSQWWCRATWSIRWVKDNPHEFACRKPTPTR